MTEGAAPAPVASPIAIGVTGHRPSRLVGVDLIELTGRIGAALAAIEAAAPGATFRLIGSLAEGADMIAADAALARGWRVDAVLPFARADYAVDFADHDATDALDRHLDAVTNAFELPGRRDESGGAATAYERAGRVVMAQSDMLLAIWDGKPPAGRGGAAQMVAEAVSQGLPVLVIDPADAQRPTMLWGGLNAHGLGPEALDTVARGDLAALPMLLAALGPDAAPIAAVQSRGIGKVASYPLTFVYPLLLALAGVRSLRRSDPTPGKAKSTPSPVPANDAFDERIATLLAPRFEQADQEASAASRLFRGAFVSNFGLAALAVSLSLIGLAAPARVRPLLALAEFASIAAILMITHAGSRSAWHDRWLRCRRLAERLRCLDMSAMLGDLMLREAGVVAGDDRIVARALGLPSAVVDKRYLNAVHGRLLALLDDQIDYLARDARRMHRLEHRLHRAGGVLFIIVAVVCSGIFAIEGWQAMMPTAGHDELYHIPIGVSMLSAALPAIGAAIYGVRMQGDFAGIADRNMVLADHLRHVRTIAMHDPPTFDTLLRLVRRTTDLLGRDVGQWVRSSSARPLALPG